MIMPQVIIPYPAPMGLPYGLAPPTGAPIAIQQPLQSLPNLQLTNGSLNLDAHQNDLVKLGGLYNQMLTLQKLLEMMDASSKSATQMTATKPLSNARRILATLKVPHKFHEASNTDGQSMKQDQEAEDADFDQRISNYFNPFSSQ